MFAHFAPMHSKDRTQSAHIPDAPPADDEAGATVAVPASGAEDDDEQDTSGNEHQIDEQVLDVLINKTPPAGRMIQTPGEEF